MNTPNILMIMADQLPASAVGSYGHPTIRTPNIDRLAGAGTQFDAAYTNCPICAPARASMCTGRYVSEIGAFDNGTDFPSSTPTFMHHLRRAGYEVLLSGKMHFLGPDQMHGFERRLTPEIYPSSFTWTPDWTRGAYHNPGSAVDQLAESGVCDWSMQLDYDEEVCFRAEEALRHLARRERANRPFFLCASFTHPHDPFITTKDWWNVYEHDAVEMPSAPTRAIEDLHPYDQWLQIHHMVDVHPPGEASIRNARHAFYGMVSYFDHLVGRLVDELERLGMADDTIIVVTSDHGEMLGEHGMWFKRTYFDPSTRIPLVVSGPGVAKGRVDQTVSLVDLYPTLIELADLGDRDEVGETLDGHSLMGLLNGTDPNWKNYAVSEYYSEGVCQPMRMAVRDRLKYVYVHDEAEQLFDLNADPNEMCNEIANAEYADRLSDLRTLVHQGWDPVEMRTRVIRSQRRRRWINEAPRAEHEVWDVQPQIDASRQYVREHDAQETSRRLRFPRTDP